MKHHYPDCQGGPDCECDERESQEDEAFSSSSACSAEEIDLLIVDVLEGSIRPEGGWECTVELGEIGGAGNPWLTVRSDDVERYPIKGDVLRVRKPKAVCFVPSA